ncbi:butyrophilin-like protein 2 isoform X3 [Onychostoma macrolepis]|uniref:butyrophilin-like protein 2 isoform X3 n=1 Tax=Onychostoma macrolepis TaxID=369639 RepID=UPI00272A98EE|nr:butyrophilin-like protein 2 isoform X3 [Onychostoma macrolepis]
MAARSDNDFQLVIPERGERVKINSGSNLTVSCHLSPALSAVDMEITWFGEMSCVCAYKNREMTQGADYEGRASLFISDLPRGNVSLRVADFRESDLGVYMCRVSSRNETRQITVNVAEEVSAIFEGQHSFTVNYQMEETSNKLSEHQGDSDNQFEDYKIKEAIYQLSIHSAYHRASGKDQHKDYKGETDDKLSSQYIKSDLSHLNKQSGDNSMGIKSKDFLSRASYHNEPKKSQHGMEVLNKNFQLVAPSPSEEPEVSLGSDLIIPCHLSPEISAVDLEIIWSNDTACVCLYEDRRVTEGALFKDRASLFTHKLREGDVSLRLKNFSLSDIGNYHCQVSSKDRRERVTVKVRINPGVQSMSQSPIFAEGNEDKRTREPTDKLSRRTSHHSDSDEKQHGIKWFKETDCVCIYKNGHVIEGRSYKDRASLCTHVLERGNVSLHLNNFSVSDVGDYCCQVTSRDTTKQITVGVRIKPEVQPVSQSPTSQGQSVQLMLFETDKIWTEEETNQMDESALMSEMKVNNMQELQQKFISAYRKGSLNWS